MDTVFISYAGDSNSDYKRYATHSVTNTNEISRASSVDAIVQQFDSHNIKRSRDKDDIKGGNIPSFIREVGNAKNVVVYLSDKYFISPHTMCEWDLIHKDASDKTIRYAYYIYETIIAKDGTEFKSGSKLIRDSFNEYLKKCIEPTWRNWFDVLKQDVESSNRPLTEVEAYACNGDFDNKELPEKYDDVYIVKNVFRHIPSILKDACVYDDVCNFQIGSTAAFNFAKWIADEFKIQSHQVEHKHNWGVFSGLVNREPCANGLLKKIKNYPFVNLTGVGGMGKSSLTNLMVFDNKGNIKSPFLHIAYFSVNSNFKSSIVDGFKGSCFYCPDYKFKGDTLKQGLDNCKSKDAEYKLIVDYLGEAFLSNGDMINLFIIDINDYDEEAIQKFVSDLTDNHQQDDNQRLYPKGWKVLFISRFSIKGFYEKAVFNIDYNINHKDKIQQDIDYLSNIFADIKNENPQLYDYYFNNHIDQKNELLGQLFYSPSLVNLLTKKIDHKTNPEGVYKILGTSRNQAKINFEVFQKDPSPSTTHPFMEDYMKHLVNYSKLPYQLQVLMSYFMIWPADYVKDEVGEMLTAKCPSVKDNWKWSDAVKEAVSSGLLAKKYETNQQSVVSYSLHGLLAQTMLKQYINRYQQVEPNIFKRIWRALAKPFWRNGIKKRYLQYIANCESILNNDNVADYLGCISNSMQYNIGNVDKLMCNPKIDVYVRIQNIRRNINNCSENEYLQRASLYFDIAWLHYSNPDDYSISDANEFFAKSAELYQKDGTEFINISKSLYYTALTCDKLGKDSILMYQKVADCNANTFYRAIAYWRLADLDDEYDENLYYSKAKDILMKNDLELNFLNDEEKTFFVKVFYDCCINGVDTNYVKLEDKLLTLYQQIQSVADGVPVDTAPLYYKEIMANTYCRIADSTVALVEQQDMYDKAIVLFEEVTNAYDLNDYSKKNLANAYYRSSFLRKNRFVGDVYFQKADSIWSSLPAETEGPLKGFVKTSYGIYDPEFGFKLVKVEKGSFNMGFSFEEDSEKYRGKYYKSEKDESPAHRVVIKEDFYIGMFPVTKGQWNKCRERIKIPSFEEMEKDGINTEEYFNGNKYTLTIGGKADNCPMNYVSADDADKFILQMVRLGRKYSLPTEAQWEYAARGGANNSVRHIFSGSDSFAEVADCNKKYNIEGELVSYVGPDKVGSRKANELGIYDMSGGVWEWCQDWYNFQWYSLEYRMYWNDPCPESKSALIDWINKEYYLNNKIQSIKGGCRCRVLRGGSWYNVPQYCRVSYRFKGNPFRRHDHHGFRLAFVP